MAQTRRKRQTKHRGNAAGQIEVRGKTHKGATNTGRAPTRQELARQRREERMDRPPSWQSAANRAGIAAILFVVLVIVAFKRPVTEALALGGFVLLFYIPLGYVTDLAMYNRRQRRKARERAG